MVQRVVSLGGAQRIADLFGIKMDLDGVGEVVELLLEAHAKLVPEPRMLEALSTAAVVRYCRCFEGGVRARLGRENVAKFAPEFLVLHDYLFDLRQKHLVHSVSEFEANWVVVTVPGQLEGDAGIQLEVVGGRVFSIDEPTSRHLGTLARVLASAESSELATLKEGLLRKLRAMSAEELALMPEVGEFAPDWQRSGTKRERME